MATFKVIIVGGGLTGALLANGLRNNDIEFTLYERDKVDSKREGYQIRLGAGAQAGFDACLTDAQNGAIKAKLGRSAGLQQTAPLIYTTRFEEVLDLSLLPNYAKSVAINRVVLRDLLLEPIELSDKIRYGKAFERYEIVATEGGGDRVKVYFQDGSSDICDILVGADGANSKVNKQIGLNNIRLLDSRWSFLSKRGLFHERMLRLPVQLRKRPLLVFTEDITLFYGLYLPQGNASSSDANPKETLQFDQQAASFYWGMNIATNRLPYRHASEITNHTEVCLQQIKSWAPEFHDMLTIGDDADDNDFTVTQFRASTQPRADWRSDCQKHGSDGQGHSRIWMIGDAMHAIQPNRGQGGNTALAGCADMLPHLLHLRSIAKSRSTPLTNDEISKACNEYEAVMIPRAFQWVKKSGGTSFPEIDLDGWKGRVVRLAGKLVLPVLRLYYSLFSKKEL